MVWVDALSGAAAMIGSMTAKRRNFLYPGEEVRPSRTPKLRLDGATKRVVDTGRIRLIVTAGLFGLAFIGIAGRIVDLMLLENALGIPAARTSAKIPTPAHHRADIIDRNGILIATNLPTVNLYADSQKCQTQFMRLKS